MENEERKQKSSPAADAASNVASKAGKKMAGRAAKGALKVATKALGPWGLAVDVGVEGLSKYWKPMLMGCFGFLALLIMVPILFLVVIFGGAGGRADSADILRLTKNVSPSRIEINAPATVVNYTILVKNTLSDPDEIISNIRVSDATLGVSYTIPSLAGGEEDIRSFSDTITNTSSDLTINNSAIATGTLNLGEENEQEVTTDGRASVIIGNPPDLPPTGCPVVSAITTPKGDNIPRFVGGIIVRRDHTGVDISSGVPNNRVRTTLTGTATLEDSVRGGKIVRVCNGIFCVLFLHLRNEGRVSGEVVLGDPIGIESETGNSRGIHVHYNVYEGGALRDPMEYMPVTLNYTPPPNLDFSSFSPLPGFWGTCNSLP